MNTCYVVSTNVKIANTNEENFTLLGSYPTLNQAKTAVGSFTPAVLDGTYDTVSIYKIDLAENLVYTFREKDLRPAYEENLQKMQLQLQTQQSQSPNVENLKIDGVNPVATVL